MNNVTSFVPPTRLPTGSAFHGHCLRTRTCFQSRSLIRPPVVVRRSCRVSTKAVFVWSSGDELFADDDADEIEVDSELESDEDEEDDEDVDDDEDDDDMEEEDDDDDDDDDDADGSSEYSNVRAANHVRPRNPGFVARADNIFGGSASDFGSQSSSLGSNNFGDPSSIKNPALADSDSGNRLYSALRSYTSGPDDIGRMRSSASECATDAFKRTVLGIMGALPSDNYEVSITTDRMGLWRLMQSSLCTGYSLRNAEYRMTLNDTLSPGAIASPPGGPESHVSGQKYSDTSASTFRSSSTSTSTSTPPRAVPSDDTACQAIPSDSSSVQSTPSSTSSASSKRGRSASKDRTSKAKKSANSSQAQASFEPDYMRNVPFRGKVDSSNISGTVKWWDSDRDLKQEMSAGDYVSKLEAEIELLRDRLAAASVHDDHTSNRLLEFMKTLSSDKISGLQSEIGSLTEDAFCRVIKSILGDLNSSKIQTTYSTSRDYLAHITFWCLLVGYTLRNLEKRMEMQNLFEIADSGESSVLNSPAPPSSSSSPKPPPSTPPSPPES